MHDKPTRVLRIRLDREITVLAILAARRINRLGPHHHSGHGLLLRALLPRLLHDFQQLILQRLQPLPRHRRHNKHRPTKLLFEVFLDEFRQFRRIGNVRLIEHNDPGPIPQIPQANIAHQYGFIRGQFRLQGLNIRNRIPARLNTGGIYHMHQYGRTFDMPQEVQAQALTLAGAGNQPRYVRNGECFMPHIDDAQVRLQRGKRVVTDLWFRRRQHRNER